MSIAQREIKFRFYSNVTKKMYNDLSMIGLHYSYNNNPAVYGPETIPYEECGERVHHYSDGHLMQYTGLKDKDGIEIYEGDLVTLIKPESSYTFKGSGYEDVGVEESFEASGKVKFLYSCWFIEQGEGKGIPLNFDEKSVIEITGNIHEGVSNAQTIR